MFSNRQQKGKILLVYVCSVAVDMETNEADEKESLPSLLYPYRTNLRKKSDFLCIL